MTFEVVGTSDSDSGATDLNAGGTINTKPSTFTELDASTAVAVKGFWVCLQNSSVAREFLVDIATGGSGSEVVIVENILVSNSDVAGHGVHLFFPISIASGTRLSARCQSDGISAIIECAIIIQDDSGLDITALTNCDTLGADTSDSGGKQVDPGATPNTKGVYSELVASSAQNYKALTIIIGAGGNAALSTAGFLLDIATGPGGTEVDFLKNITLGSGNQSDLLFPAIIGPIACDIPASSRISARAQTSITNAADRVFDIILLGMN